MKVMMNKLELFLQVLWVECGVVKRWRVKLLEVM